MSTARLDSGKYNKAKVLNISVPCCSWHLILSSLTLMGFVCNWQIILMTPIHWRIAESYLCLQAWHKYNPNITTTVLLISLPSGSKWVNNVLLYHHKLCQCFFIHHVIYIGQSKTKSDRVSSFKRKFVGFSFQSRNEAIGIKIKVKTNLEM